MPNSKQKGNRGEREFAHFLTDHGFPARRGQQFQGSPDSPDVVCDSLKSFHFEVKRVEKLSLYPAMDQARSDAGGSVPIVAHKRNRKDWLVIMSAEDFINLLEKNDD